MNPEKLTSTPTKQEIWKNLQVRVSEQEHLCYGFLVRAKKTSGELFSDNSFSSAILDRQGFMFRAPVDLRTKEAESFSP